MRHVILILILLLVSGPAFAGEPYPDEVREAFLTSCEREGDAELCACVLERMEAEIPLVELAEQRMTQAQLERMTYTCAGFQVTEPVTSCATALMCKGKVFRGRACEIPLPEASAARFDALVGCVADAPAPGCSLADRTCLQRACEDPLEDCLDDQSSCSEPCDDGLLCVDGVCLSCDDEACEMPEER